MPLILSNCGKNRQITVEGHERLSAKSLKMNAISPPNNFQKDLIGKESISVISSPNDVEMTK